MTLSVACGGDSTAPSTGPGPISPPATPPVIGGPAPLRCPFRESAASRTTYYFATNELGADNERCDGLSPTDRGGGRCPFKDFQSAATFRLLRDVSSVRVELRAGTYTLTNEGLTVSGAGGGRVVVTAYQEEAVVLDGENTVRELLRLSGVGVTIERLTFQNAGAHNIEVRGGSDHVIQCNRFLQNRASDSLKGTGGAGTTTVRDNEFSRWDSQAIDLTNISRWTIVDNVFRDSLGVNANAIGAKLGARDVLVARNQFENTGGLAFGGVGGAHDDSFEAFRVTAEHNTFDELSGAAVKFYSCSQCSFRNNDINGALGGIVLGGVRLEGPSGCTGGCRPTRGAVVTGNRLRRMRGGVEGDPDTFWFVNASESSGIVAGENLYCFSVGGSARFIFAEAKLSFAEWTMRLGTDETSTIASETDSVCVGS